MGTMRKLAVFDIDGTLFRSSLLIELVDALIAQGLFPKDARKVYDRAYLNWVSRRGSYERYIGGVVKAFERHLKGVHYGEFAWLAKAVVARERERVYRYTRDLLGRLRRQGRYILAISHSPKIVADEFAEHFGFSKVYGMMYETDKAGFFTGEVLHGELIGDKGKILTRAVEREGLTLAGSVGVGDTESDIPFLKLVAKPICFNPNRKLYAAAKRAGWPVVVERKDVVYQL